MNLTVIGTGYVGLIVGNCFAKQGHFVYCIDNDKEKILKLNEGISPIFEKDLDELISYNLNFGNIKYLNDINIGLSNSDIIFLAVGTPSKDDGSCDLKFVDLALDNIISYYLENRFEDYKYIFIKSTVVVGTADYIKERLRKSGLDRIIVVSNPEFLREGSSVYDFLNPDRIIIGLDDILIHKNIIDSLYHYYIENNICEILYMSNKSAELSKYACNCFLATKISFANEIANLSKSLGANYEDVKKAMGSDSRISPKFLNAGPGYGGSCFPKDVRALINLGYPVDLIKKGYDVNENQKLKMFEMVDKYVNLNNFDKKVVIWGCTFKPGTDDIRESPSIKVVDNFLENGYEIMVHDPVGMENFKLKYLDKLIYLNDKYDFRDFKILIIMVNWDEYYSVDLSKLKGVDVFDAFGILDENILDDRYYERIGR
ncbi:MAG: UDP-glucose/GDP-mannose dehydrogenase family protein [Candidatus Nanoarchaeia archaeon]|nr:UDP-glucose/GDP-mannose dehydrogenase family protein [Candidatus Nanoarchaeia archaeon]